MVAELDGFAVLQRIGSHPHSFVYVKIAVTKAAQDLVTKQLKAKTTTLQDIRAVRKVLGPEQFGILLDGMNDASIKSILTRLDKHHPDLKVSDNRWKRSHLRALFEGAAEPSIKQHASKGQGSGRSKTRKTEQKHLTGLGSEVIDVFRQSIKRK
jgi:hypothetical protein